MLTLLLTEHHCPVCQTALSSDKSKTHCIGVHVEWCHRYHTLFRVNWSSHCSACKTTDEQHEKRHREIAEILAKIRQQVEEQAAASRRAHRAPLTAVALNTVQSSAPIQELAPDTLGTQKVTKKEKKAAKNAAKALGRDKVITTSDIQVVAKALHSEAGKDGEMAEAKENIDKGEDPDIIKNLKYNPQIWSNKDARRDFMSRDSEQTDIDDSDVARILGILEINIKTSGGAAELIKELIAAIKKDLVAYQDELKKVAETKAAFWRWANKSAYRDFVDKGKVRVTKSQWDPKDNAPPNQHRDSTIAVEPETDEESSSIDEGVAESAGTSLTVPSRKAPPTKKAGDSVQNGDIPSDKTIVATDDGRKLIGTKLNVIKPDSGKITFTSNGGAEHLNVKPKDRFAALSISGPSKEGPCPVESPPPVNEKLETFRRPK